MKTELWQEIPGYPDYEASNLGRIRSWKSGNGRGDRAIVPRILRSAPDSYGYQQVVLMKDGDRYARKVHHLVLWAFVGERPHRHMEACHGPAGRSNNSIDNLSWGTKTKNHGEDRRRDGTSSNGEQNGRAKLNEHNIIEIRNSTLNKNDLAMKFGVSICTINDILKGRTWTHV